MRIREDQPAPSHLESHTMLTQDIRSTATHTVLLLIDQK